jgi:uncharacterized delta-60 repeat protein
MLYSRTLFRPVARASLWPQRILAIGSLVVLLSWCLPNIVRADDGDLDPDFGEGGKVTTSFAEVGYVSANSIAVQPDGKVVVAGAATGAGGGTTDFALVRYNGNGTLDSAFGTNGKVTTGILRAYDEAFAVAIQSDGKIVAAGGSGDFSTSDGFALVRYNSDGSLDPTFGDGGKVTTAFDGGISEAHAIAILSDGTIVAGGYVERVTGFHFALARYKSNGKLDKSFGSGGKVATFFSNFFASARSMAIQPDGKIVLAGFSINESTQEDFAVARYNSDGSLDSSFGAGGKVNTDLFGHHDLAFAAALQTDGRIVLAGVSGSNTSDLALARYNSDGSLDASFGSNGKVLTDLGGDDAIYAAGIQRDGRIVAAGATVVGGEYDFTVARYESDGAIDSTFGSDGKITTDFSGQDVAHSLAIVPSGRIVAAGSSQPKGSSAAQFAIACYQIEPFNPNIISAEVSGKKLYVHGKNFDVGADLLLNGETQKKTLNDEIAPTNMLIARKSGKRIAPGETVTLQVRNRDGGLSNAFSFTRPAQ